MMHDPLSDTLARREITLVIPPKANRRDAAAQSLSRSRFAVLLLRQRRHVLV